MTTFLYNEQRYIKFRRLLLSRNLNVKEICVKDFKLTRVLFLHVVLPYYINQLIKVSYGMIVNYAAI